jgi:putative transcriptional regulator
LADPEEPVRIGGPVATESVVVLGRFEDPSRSPKIIVGDLGVVDPADTDGVTRARVYAGHSGWTGGQLEGEMDRDAWLVGDASPEDPFLAEDIWSTALQRRGGEYALLATMPEDPSLN